MSTYFHSVAIDGPRCDGCLRCMRVCPTQAIRVWRGKAEILEERCVDCALCLHACPKGAVLSMTDSLGGLERFRRRIALPSPLLYAQFGPDIPPALVRAALTGIGFDEIFDLEQAALEVALALEEELAGGGPRPLISNWCPAVVRLVQVRFPELVDHVFPVRPPREVAAQRIKEEAGILEPDDPRLGIIYLTPCPAKMIAIRQPAEHARSWLDGAMGIADIYNPLMAEIRRLQRSGWSPVPGGPPRGRASELGMAPSGVSWLADSGRPRASRVLGILNVAQGLEDVVDGRLALYDYVDCFTCRPGCADGPLTVESSYAASARLEALLAGRGPELWPVDRGSVLARARAGYYRLGRPLEPRPLSPISRDLARAVELVRERDQLAGRLPDLDCGLCGSPSCATFAEDVVRQLAPAERCVFLDRGRIAELARLRSREEAGVALSLAEVAGRLALRPANPEVALTAEVTGVYVSDLLSDVIGHAEPGYLWLTLQVHVNIIAVASLRELAGIVLVGGREPQPETVARAVENNVPLLISDLGTFELAGRLYQMGLRGGQE